MLSDFYNSLVVEDKDTTEEVIKEIDFWKSELDRVEETIFSLERNLGLNNQDIEEANQALDMTNKS